MSTPEQERANAIEIACVFDRCAAIVKLLPMRIDPKTDDRALMIDEHRFNGDAPIEICPTSNQWFPLYREVRRHLVDTARWIDEHNAAARASKPIVSAKDKQAGRRPHPLAPRVTGSHALGTPSPEASRAAYDRYFGTEPERDEREPPLAGREPNGNTPRRPLGYLGHDRYTDK